MAKIPDLTKPNLAQSEIPDLTQPNLADQDQSSGFGNIGNYLPSYQSPTFDALKTAYALYGSRDDLARNPGQTIKNLAQPGAPLGDIAQKLQYGSYFALPELGAEQGIAKTIPAALDIIKQLPSSMGRNALGGFVGTQFDPNATEKEALGVAGISGVLPLALSPVTLAMRSFNPYVRAGASAVSSGLLGATVGNAMGHGYTGGTIGALAGGLLGLRGTGAAQLAAHDIANALTPEDAVANAQRQAAASRVGVPLNAAEATGNAGLKQKILEAAQSPSGADVLGQFARKQQGAVQSAYGKFLNDITPNSSSQRTDAAYKQAEQSADAKGVKVDVRPIVNWIDKEQAGEAPNTTKSKLLSSAKLALQESPETAAMNGRSTSPIEDVHSQLTSNLSKLNDEIDRMQANAPNPYFRASTNYDQQLAKLRQSATAHQNALDLVSNLHNRMKEASGVTGYETRIRPLDQAKTHIQGMIDTQNAEEGNNVIGRGVSGNKSKAAGALKQVNKMLVNAMRTASPDYLAATKVANAAGARRQIENSLKSDISGKNIFDKIIKDPKDPDYLALQSRLSDRENPGVQTPAQRALSDFATIYPHMMDGLADRAAQGATEKAKMSAGDLVGLAKSFLNKSYMDRYHSAVATLLTSPDWQEQLHALTKMPAGEDRGIALARLISKVAVSAGMSYNQGSQQGS